MSSDADNLAPRLSFHNAVVKRLGPLSKEENHELRAAYEQGYTVEEFVDLVETMRRGFRDEPRDVDDVLTEMTQDRTRQAEELRNAGRIHLVRP